MRYPEAFGRTVRRLREERQVSQEAFAADAGISRTYMSEIERGVTTVSLDTIAKLAKALDISMATLMKYMEDSDRR
ncbi:MAG TPA: helix-turn-helix transcriptional regulator [Gemmatimonadaceae bacterium]|nr:helix-turn-helix transcriptional regulator [Gemmatimonadaceae bacterium]